MMKRYFLPMRTPSRTALSYRAMVSRQGVPRPIRIGIMCNGQRFPAWQAAAIRHLQSVPGVEIALLLIRDGDAGASRLHRLRDRPHLLWTLFNKGYVERRSRASRSVDLSEELTDVPELRCRTEPEGRFAERFTEADVAAVRAADLDLIVRFSFGIIKGAILESARYGVWSFHHGDERVYRGRPPGFWELVDGVPVVGSILQRLTERLDGGVVLHRGFFRATNHSYLRTRDDAFLGSAVWPSVVVRQIQLGQVDHVDAAPSKTDAPVRRDPTNGVMARFLATQAWHFVIAQLRGVFRAAKWSVGVVDAPISTFLAGEVPDVHWAPEPGRSRYLADPFAIERAGKLVVLAEDYEYATHRGVVSAVTIGGDALPTVVLDTGVHASYPYLVEHAGEVFCIPETYQAREVRLYRAVEFPTKWEHVATPVEDMAALDATVVRHDERWWMFCTDRDDDPNGKLHLFHAERLEGPWEPHALNPVKTDVRSSRPAGTPFVHDGALHRPAQDGSESYGGGVTITRITDLTPTTFSETAVAQIAPRANGPYPNGIHTIASAGDRTVIDGRRDTFIWPAFRRETVGRLRKLVGR
jgi:hypothetical protein